MHTFKAFVVREKEGGGMTRSIESKSMHDLPNGEVTIQVAFSSLNYKDALSASGNRGVTRQYPHTPGIDASGVVVESAVPQFKIGDQVLVTSYDLGMNTPGGFSEYIRVPAAWVIPIPPGLTLRSAMHYGTAGLTAAMCFDRLMQVGVLPNSGPVVVTGATGGVGTMAVALGKKLGYTIHAITGKPTSVDFLRELGATEVWSRSDWETSSPKPLLKPLLAGVIDTVGGTILSNLVKSIQPNGAAALCGLVASPQLDLTVFPFILRGIALLGVDSAEADHNWRQSIWEKLGGNWAISSVESFCRHVLLDDLSPEIDLILKGEQTGRIVVAVNPDL
ncbi:MAG: YhdH/YhfP family quinone oxidoreductase [Spirosomataceae bacterium]